MSSGLAAEQRFPLVATLSPAVSGSGAGESFGAALAIDGDRLVVGAPTAGDFGINSGAVYVFELRRQGWVETSRLTAPDLSKRNLFGSSVAISGDTLVVAARRQVIDRRRRGAVYVFERQGGEWLEVQKLVSEFASGLNRPWAHRVLLAGDRLVVAGREGVDVFARRGGEWSKEEFFPTSGPHDLRRRSLTLSRFDRGERLLTLFRRRAGAWIERDTLKPPPDECSWADTVSRSGRRMAIADPTDLSCPELSPGKVHVYRRSGKRWLEETQIQPAAPSSFGAPVDLFGFALAIGKRVLLAQAIDQTMPFHTSTVYVFERSGSEWIERAKLETDRGRTDFGEALLVGEEFFFVGSPSPRPGKVLVFKQ